MQDIITIKNYADFEQKFDNVMQETAERFVVIGYLLKVARDTDILRESGYSTMGEFAQKRYGLTKDIASRYIAINDRYSEGGYSEQLDQKYKAFGYAKLAEMLTLPDTIVGEISPEMTREDIRAIKSEVAEERNISDIEVMLEEKDQGVEVIDSSLGKAIYQICHEHPDILKKLWMAVNIEEAETEYLMDALAPSGIAMISYRIPGTGRYMLSINEGESLKILYLRDDSEEEFTWEELQRVAVAFLKSDAPNWKVTYRDIYNEEPPEEKPEVAPAQPKSERVVKSVKPKKPEKSKKTLKKEPEKDAPVAVQEEQLPGQMEVGDYPELMPEKMEEKDGFNKCAGCEDTGRVPEMVPGAAEERITEPADETPAERKETPQSDEEGDPKKSEKYETLKEEAEELARGAYDVFYGWSDDKVVPKGELEMALKNAKKLVNAIEALILMTGEQ